ncbi:hypothetical protein F5B19DRAFT_461233 [Rostrohypoxylon terebratum]|nr:hypothetical protein F5B19DRAFT_461233 [Rostrohypoxylon terebratum]
MSISAAIQALEASSLKELLVVPSKDEYGLRNRSYLHQIQREIMPAAIFLPRNKEQISQFVRIIKPFALSGAAPFAIRGAGQQPLPGCSNVDGGITVDLHYLTGITVKRERIEVAAGERWGNVHERLASEGLAVTGSRYAAGGIGGVALTGGISIFSSREGMICDNVISYEVVLASGEIVNANEHERPDLWRALRGGGNNFGIVTRYDFRPFEQGNFWSGHVLYSPLGFPSQIDALVRELRSPCVSDETHIEISIGHSTASAKPRRFLCVNNLYFTRVVGRPVLLEPFLQVRHQIKLLNLERMQSRKLV